MTLLAAPDDGWLVDADHRARSPNTYRSGSSAAMPSRTSSSRPSEDYKASRVKPVECIVYHYTASPRGRGTLGADEDRIRSWLRGERGKSSTHFVVLRNGVVLQGAPLTARTWHAGVSVWRDPATLELRKHVNNFSIGLDLENVGHLSRRGFEWIDTYGRAYDGPGPEMATDRKAWEPYTEPQMVAACELTARLVGVFPHLVTEYSLTPGRLVGHQHIAPRRKVDPGPAFDWDAILDAANVAGGLNACE